MDKPKKYVTIPERIRAIQWTGENKESVLNFLKGHIHAYSEDRYGRLKIVQHKEDVSEHGRIVWIVSKNDWIVEKDGEYSDMPNDYFLETYVEDHA